ncbi:putative kinesin-related protein KLPA [Ophiocordyceps camponoti-floridani]|uniref:Kinesin-like protein n=1 Tax=Ophiocordyceps camponoti-floridani TaxID=2030778 RepID=A0A8H4Q7H1_9HYPO|nr:putative kinesin-related protein KLPA [Ophiocordyceps camponoti-floridani]
MDESEIQPARGSKASRLPGPAMFSHGLAEMSESQHNIRPQSGIPTILHSGIKRETPQPALQPVAKRKPLTERALEYPTKPNASQTTGLKGMTISAIPSQSRPPSRLQAPSSRPASSFAKSFGPGRSTGPKAVPEPTNGRPKGPASRPRTAHGHRSDLAVADESTTGSGTNHLPSRRQRSISIPPPLHVPKVRDDKMTPWPLKARESSLATKMKSLTLSDASLSQATDRTSSGVSASQSSLARSDVPPKTPTAERVKHQLGVVENSISAFKNRRCPSKSPSPRKFLTKGSNLTAFTAWDVDGRVENIEGQFQELRTLVTTEMERRQADEIAYKLAKTRVSELEDQRRKLEERQEKLKDELDAARDDSRQLRHQVEKQQWDQQRAVDDAERRHRETLDEAERRHRETLTELERRHQSAVDGLKRGYKEEQREAAAESQRQLDSLTRRHRQELEDERHKREGELAEVQTRLGNDQRDLGQALERKDGELRELRLQAESSRANLEREKSLTEGLQRSLTELTVCKTTLEAKISSLKSQVEFLESDSKAQSDSFASMEARLQEALRTAEFAQQRLIKEETERRVLFNKYQELKGNIRVMCRVRPALAEAEGAEAGMSFPDDKTSAEIVVAGPEERSSLGAVTRKNHPFEFDRVFGPGTSNSDIFGEISQLVQSALDGYNVCIFCYGQTGSGKTFTMSGEDGMIPRATHMIYDTMTRLRDKSWEYSMEGSFVEVYNEELHDLLSPGQQRRLEIHHDEARRQTNIAHCKTVRLDSAGRVEEMLAEAQRNRSVAATRANERSSRSHSVFILRLVGDNTATGERCEGTLNLVDLAGSERLKHSQAEGERMRETQSINKSLSCLGDVIEALGRGSGHVPYRNSKLTHLLQYSLGGSSKTLMFVMVSPLEVHLKETLTSLRFATKVHNTHIGTAKATRKMRPTES